MVSSGFIYFDSESPAAFLLQYNSYCILEVFYADLVIGKLALLDQLLSHLKQG